MFHVSVVHSLFYCCLIFHWYDYSSVDGYLCFQFLLLHILKNAMHILINVHGEHLCAFLSAMK